MQHTQVALDNHRYLQRRKDAALHSRNLLQCFPVDLIKPPLASNASYTGLSVRHEVSDPEYLAFDKYRRRLHEFNRKEYDPSSSKKQKIVFEKIDHVREQNERNQSILKKLQKELSNCRRSDKRIRYEKMDKRSAKEPSEMSDQSATVQNMQEQQQSDDKSNNADPALSISDPKLKDKSVLATYREKEIAELEASLRAQHLSRTSEIDRLFYNHLAEREANTILEEVLLDNIYDLATDIFDEEEEKSRCKELPPELLEIVENALHGGPLDEILIQKYNVDITRRHLQCLLPVQWLNDEVINFYFQLMSDRDEALVKAGVLPKRSHFFNSFFYTKVSENGYNFINVRRWTRKIDLFAMDKIFMPVNVGNMHWCMAVIFMTEKRIQYYDSMHGSGASCIKVLMRYLHDESEHKRKTKFDEQGWELVTTTPDTPSQTNGSDCGVFSCIFADYISQNMPLSFKQKDIPFHRHRMVLHITRGYVPLEEEGF